MDVQQPGLAPDWKTAEEAKQAVIEETLFDVFNPLGQLDEKSQAKRPSVFSYTVAEGDTLSEIANRYGITLDDLMEQNKIMNPNLVGIGMKLIVKRDEVKHVVQRGDTIELVAKRYQVSKEKIMELNPLAKVMPDELFVGQVLHIPIQQAQPMASGHVNMRRQLAQVASRKSTGSRMMDWPIPAPTITSNFGMRWGKMHKGVDLWNENKSRTPILAAKSGQVIEAGANRAGYGYMVVIDHGGGLQTFYAHMRKIIVHVGDEVDSGDILGYMGKSGDSTGYHLHFEVRQDDVPLNPLRYLRK
ncbi:M23 family metallopeptidase [Brevibacillus dissolubilis]|uniref:M23 family metallopeptidase n=1 Tax=Brevibacillus dissolubilis TaxID=1844116 RepID=UPI001115BE07|nr:M23 family metallopeptidase [Brevibacillus dissolubilis]